MTVFVAPGESDVYRKALVQLSSVGRGSGRKTVPVADVQAIADRAIEQGNAMLRGAKEQGTVKHATGNRWVAEKDGVHCDGCGKPLGSCPYAGVHAAA